MGEVIAACERLGRRLLMLIWRGRVSRVDDTGAVQTIQIAINPAETKDKVPRLAEYGFTSNPPAGTDVLFVCLGGNRTNAVAIGTNHQGSRKKGLAVGEVAIYDNHGQSIHLTQSGIVIQAPLGVECITPKIKSTGEIVDCSEQGNTVTISDIRRWLNNHTHEGVIPGDGKSGRPTEAI